jgi:hypothetical protein
MTVPLYADAAIHIPLHTGAYPLLYVGIDVMTPLRTVVMDAHVHTPLLMGDIDAHVGIHHITLVHIGAPLRMVIMDARVHTPLLMGDVDTHVVIHHITVIHIGAPLRMVVMDARVHTPLLIGVDVRIHRVTVVAATVLMRTMVDLVGAIVRLA